MEKTDKSDIDILNENASFKCSITNGNYSCVGVPYTDAKKAMHEYADQKVAKYKAVIEKLLPLAEFLLNNTWRKSSLPENTHGIINEARRLLELTPGNDPQSDADRD